MMIIDFKCKETEKIFKNKSTRKFPAHIIKRAYLKLRMLHVATNFEQVKSVDPKFKKIPTDQTHDYQITVNDQFRIRFNIVDEMATQVEIIEVQLKDFH